jgi:uncharacterized protein (TIRG00374 family)
MDLRKRWKDLLYLSLGAFLIAILLLRADVTDTFDTMASIDILTVIFVLILYFFNLFCKIVRWRSLIIGMGGKEVNRTVVPIYISALALNNSTPGKIGGEPFRALMLKEHTGNSASLGIATVFIEKALDTFTVLFLASYGLVYLVFILGFDSVSGMVYSLLIVGIVATALIALSAHPVSLPIVRRIIDLSPRRPLLLRRTLEKGYEVQMRFHESFATLRRRPRVVVGLAMLSFAIWLNEALRLYLIIRAIPGGPDIQFGGAIAAMSIANILGFVLPLGSGIVLGAASVIELISGKGASTAATAASIVQVITSIWIAIPLGLASLAYLRNRSKKASAAVVGPEVG